MPLLCISLLALLLLPPTLSCGSKRPHEEIRNDYMAIVQTDLNNTREKITALMPSSSCPALKHKLRSCTPNITNIENTLHILACKMKNLRLSHTDRLAVTVQYSIRCPCPEKSTKEPSLTSRPARRRRRNQHNKNKEIKKLCKAKVLLSTVTQCYEILNAILTDI
ncbi:hypothetical protein JOB18_031851 [Solea senegalensis]|uniref:Interleukin-7 n=1 Tax=Solea senegalensis TaxID=28829 RepID=A0AAV6T8P0_SOLSE|nr:hypothetical protein JOB18_031851 [Solea senegalensis]